MVKIKPAFTTKISLITIAFDIPPSLSNAEIRQRINNYKDINRLTSYNVRKYIHENGLYKWMLN